MNSEYQLQQNSSEMKRNNLSWNGSYNNTSDVGYGDDYYDPIKDVLELEMTDSEEE